MPNIDSSLLQNMVLSLCARARLRVVSQEHEFRSVLHSGKEYRADAAVELETEDGRRLVVVVELLTSAYPRDVRECIAHFQDLDFVQGISTRPNDSPRWPISLVPFVLARELSSGARDLLREASINFYDDSGTLYFRHGSCLIDVERSAKTKPRRIGNLFKGARERVVHTMLHQWLSCRKDPDAGWMSGGMLAEQAGTSTYTVSTLMQELERNDLVHTKGKGPGQQRRLAQPGQLLDEWAAEWIVRKEERSRWYLYAGRVSVEDKLMWALQDAQPLQGWALTGAAAANAIVPHLTAVEQASFIIPPGQTEEWQSRFALERTDKGANLVLIEREGAALMFTREHPERPGSHLASPFIQYLDLLDGYGRNKELAREFRTSALKMDDSDVY